jgi:hypothetical protein
LNHFGRSFSAFCRLRRDVFAAELAELEWAIVEAIHASGGGALSLERLATVPAERWAEARFLPAPHLRLLEFTHPVNAFYQAYRGDLEPCQPDAEASRVAVYRSGTSVWRADLCPARSALLRELLAGVPLGDALDRAASRDEVSSDDVLAWFAKGVEEGFFRQISW